MQKARVISLLSFVIDYKYKLRINDGHHADPQFRIFLLLLHSSGHNIIQYVSLKSGIKATISQIQHWLLLTVIQCGDGAKESGAHMSVFDPTQMSERDLPSSTLDARRATPSL